MAPTAARLSELIGRDVLMARDWRQVAPLPGDVVLLENVRFNPGEVWMTPRWQPIMQRCAMSLSWMLLALRIVPGVDSGVAHAVPVARGPGFGAELRPGAALDHARRPMLAVVGGSKVSTKLQVRTRSHSAATA